MQSFKKPCLVWTYTIDPISGDGDCVFTSIVKQLRRLPEVIENEPSLTAHLAALGLGDSQEEDAYRLRQLFVDQVQSNEMYQMVTGVDPFLGSVVHFAVISATLLSESVQICYKSQWL